MFGLDNKIRIGDFGSVIEHINRQINSSRKKNSATQNHTKTIGTEYYAAPELSTGIYDHKVDIFSIGVILFEMIQPNILNDEKRFERITQFRNTPFPKDYDESFKPEVSSKRSLYQFISIIIIIFALVV